MIKINYDKKMVSKEALFLLGVIALNIISVLTYIQMTPKLLKWDLFFLLFIILNFVSVYITLLSKQPYVIITDKDIKIDRKKNILLKNIKYYKHNQFMNWLYFKGSKIPMFYGIKTDFISKKDKERLLKKFQTKLKTSAK